MKKLYFLIILKLIFLSSVSYAQTYQSLNINGFNQDVIANGIGTAATSTTSDVDGVSYSFKSIDWMLTSESSPQTVGFPVNGIINSEATPGVMYQLKDYSTSNSIQLKSSNPSIISNVSGSVKAKKLFVLVTSGSGVSSLTCKITFEDNTKEVFSDIAISDWYSGTSPAIAFRGFGRIGRMNNIVEYSSSNPRLYEASLPISVANENKAIKNIEFLRESSSGGVLNIFAVSAQKYINCPNPLAVTISDISGTTAKVNLTLPSVLPSSGYDYEVRTSGAPGSGAIGLVSSGTISFDSTVYNLLNLPALKKLYFYIRSNCGTTGVQDWMETISFVTNCEIPKLIYTNSENTCKNSSATLSAHYDSGTIRWFDSSTSDTLLAVGNSFVTPNLSSSKSYWVEAMATEFLNSSAGKKDLGGLSNDVNTFDNWGIVFDLNQDVLLKSTDIFVGNYGTLDIAIKDNLGNELFSTGDISVNTSDIDKRATIPLNFKLTAGTGYRMVIKSFSEIKLFRDSYASFPYKDDNDVLIVTSGFFDGFTKDYYYYFYNIAFEKECFSPRTEVIATIYDTPVPTASNQEFCIAEAKTIDDLVVTGTDVKWYNEVTGGTALDPTTVLVSGTYYATQTLNGCESVDRTEVVVTIYNTPAPTTADQAFCIAESKMIDDLVVTGTDVKWYNTQTSGTALDATALLIDGTTYYATQTLNNCESVDRTPVVVTIEAPTAPTVNATIQYTYGETAVALTATTSANHSLLWYTTETGGTSINTSPTPTTDAVGTQTYWVSQVTTNGCESKRTKIEVIINQATLTITADVNQSKMYGETDPVLTYTDSGYQGTDDNSILSGALSRVAGEDVGTYVIEQGTLTAGDNYDIVFISDDFTINKATLTITADANQSKGYGETDPVLTYTDSGYQGTDDNSILSGALSRAAGENVGTYAIEQGTLTAGDNYDIVFVSNDFTINKATLTITADANQSKGYGETDPVLTYTDSGYQHSDNNSILSGALSRAAGEDVGIYAIEQGTLTAGDNYDIVFVSDDFTITKATLTITPHSGQGKTYGSTNPVYPYDISGFVLGDTAAVINGALGRQSGENVGTYLYNAGSLTAQNYTFVIIEEYFAITPAPIEVHVNPGQSKAYGATDPVLTYTANGLVNGDTQANAFTGSLQRVPGENTGVYAIKQGTLQPNANYQLTSFTGADFEIKKAVITGIKLENAAFVYDGTPKSLYLTGNIQPGAQVSYTGNGQTEAGEYTVTATVDYGSNYEILVLTAKLKIVQAEQVIDFELNSPVILEDMTPFQLDATASSGLAVYYSFNYIENHPAMVSSDGHVALMEPGTVEITAHQEGNNNYKAAQPITRTLVVESRDSRIWELYIDGDKYENPSQETRVIKGCDDTDSPFVEIQVETQAGATVSPSEVIVVPTPEYGTYEVEIIVTSPNAKHSQTYKVIIEKRLPWEGVLMQKYDNLVFVNNNPATNGGHKFVRYQWYKNGVKVADHKVFSEGAAMDDILDPEAEYHAILYTQDGQVLTTCTMGVRLRHDYALSVYPNPVAKKQTLNVRVDDPKEAFEQSDYSIYSQTGQLIQRGKLTQALSAIGLPPTIQAGTYILVLKIDGEHKSVHFVVKP
jgi:hypothetical protein